MSFGYIVMCLLTIRQFSINSLSFVYYISLKLEKLSFRSELVTFVMLIVFSPPSIVVNFFDFDYFKRSDNFQKLCYLPVFLVLTTWWL